MMPPMQGGARRLAEPLDTTVEVETPEHVRFRYQIAGPGRRAAAYLVDLTIRGVLVLGLAIALTLALAIGSGFEKFGGFELGALLVIYFAVEWGYYVVSELLMNGSSPGKRALGLRVVQSDGLPITFTDSFLRNLVRAADLLPSFYALGLLSMVLDARFRRLGDLVAGTIVIHEPRARLATLGRNVRQLQQRGFGDEAAVARELDQLPERPALSREERQALALFSRRGATLSPQRAEELADLIAPALAQRWGIQYRSSAAFLEALHQRVSAQASMSGR